MGMYTELYTDFKFKKNTPDYVIETIKFISDMDSIYNDECEIIALYPDVEFFKCENIFILNCNNVGLGSGYIKSYGDFSLPFHKFINDSGQWILNSISNFKNYDSNIDKFFTWIAPYIDRESNKAIGYSLYEENEGCPYYYKINNDCILESVNSESYMDTKGLDCDFYEITEYEMYEDYNSEVINTIDVDNAIAKYKELTSENKFFGAPIYTFKVFRDYSLIYEYEKTIEDEKEFKEKLLNL